MTALSDAERAVHEAREAALRNPTRDSLNHLVAAVRHHDAEIARTEGHEWSGEAGRAILQTADKLDPKEPTP